MVTSVTAALGATVLHSRESWCSIPCVGVMGKGLEEVRFCSQMSAVFSALAAGGKW